MQIKAKSLQTVVCGCSVLIGAAVLASDNQESQSSLAEGPRLLAPAEAGIGHLIPDLECRAVTGKPFRLSQLKPNSALVIAFTSSSCPVANRYAPTLAALEKQYASRGVKFILVNPVSTDSQSDIKNGIRRHGLQGPYIRDAGGRITAALGARSTTEAFVLDAARTLVYRGAIDDQYGLGYSHDAPRHHYLAEALESLLAGRSPEIAATEAPGCALDSSSAKTVANGKGTGGTFHNRSSRVL